MSKKGSRSKKKTSMFKVFKRIQAQWETIFSYLLIALLIVIVLYSVYIQSLHHR